MPRYRTIVARSIRREKDRITPEFWKRPVWVWRAGADVTTVTLSCGHTKEYRGTGDVAPKDRALCKECL